MTKELEALNSIKFGCCNFEDRTLYQDEFNIIEIALERLIELENIFSEIKSGEVVVVSAEKSVALEIIKEKRVDVSMLLGGFYGTLEEYNSCELIYKKLTKEEYDLLKEVLL